MPLASRLAVVAVPLLLAVSAPAAPPAQAPPPAAPAVQPADANRDGVVDEKEMRAKVTDDFQAADTNRDGKLSPDEVKAAAGKEFDSADADHDGKLTAAELAKARCGDAALRPDPSPAPAPAPAYDPRSPAWPQTDRNRDGAVSPLECSIQAGAEHSWMSGSGSRTSTTTKTPGGSRTVSRSEYTSSGGSVGVGVNVTTGQAIDLGQKLIGFFGKK